MRNNVKCKTKLTAHAMGWCVSAYAEDVTAPMMPRDISMTSSDRPVPYRFTKGTAAAPARTIQAAATTILVSRDGAIFQSQNSSLFTADASPQRNPPRRVDVHIHERAYRA